MQTWSKTHSPQIITMDVLIRREKFGWNDKKQRKCEDIIR